MNLYTRKRILDLIFIVFTGVFFAAIYVAYRSDALGLSITFGIGIIVMIIVAARIRRLMPSGRDYKYFEYFLADNQYKKADFKAFAPAIREKSHYLSKKGSFSVLYSNPALKTRYVAALTPPDGRNKYSVLPEYTVFMAESGSRFCEHCLAFLRRSRENAAFSIIYGESFNALGEHPSVQLYSTEKSLPRKTVEIVSGILDRLNSPLISIECFDRWILLVIRQIPDKNQISFIMDNLQTTI